MWRLLVSVIVVATASSRSHALTQSGTCLEARGADCFCRSLPFDHAIIGTYVDCPPPGGCMRVVRAWARTGVEPLAVGTVVPVGIFFPDDSPYLVFREFRPDVVSDPPQDYWYTATVLEDGTVQIPSNVDLDQWCQSHVSGLPIEEVAELLVAEDIRACRSRVDEKYDLPEHHCDPESRCSGASNEGGTVILALIVTSFWLARRRGRSVG